MPAINPFSTTNKNLSEDEIDERLARYDIPTDLPLVVQISRFDKWKDPQGVIEAFRIARKEVDCTLVLVGNVATDDPEGQEVFESLCECSEERIRILSVQDSALVNALQRRAAVVLQKSMREGFGLTVAEAMWKGTPVIGGKVGGIKHQIEDGVNGFLVESIAQAAERIVQVVERPGSCASELGRARQGDGAAAVSDDAADGGLARSRSRRSRRISASREQPVDDDRRRAMTRRSACRLVRSPRTRRRCPRRRQECLARRDGAQPRRQGRARAAGLCDDR